jgi:predicted lipid-binding transport protein (Tim44 family)
MMGERGRVSAPSAKKNRRSVRAPVSASPAQQARQGSSFARWAGPLLLVILAGYLLFAHGCHGDEDNELFTSFARALVRLWRP